MAHYSGGGITTSREKPLASFYFADDNSPDYDVDVSTIAGNHLFFKALFQHTPIQWVPWQSLWVRVQALRSGLVLGVLSLSFTSYLVCEPVSADTKQDMACRETWRCEVLWLARQPEIIKVERIPRDGDGFRRWTPKERIERLRVTVFFACRYTVRKRDRSFWEFARWKRNLIPNQWKKYWTGLIDLSTSPSWYLTKRQEQFNCVYEFQFARWFSRCSSGDLYKFAIDRTARFAFLRTCINLHGNKIQQEVLTDNCAIFLTGYCGRTNRSVANSGRLDILSLKRVPAGQGSEVCRTAEPCCHQRLVHAVQNPGQVCLTFHPKHKLVSSNFDFWEASQMSAQSLFHLALNYFVQAFGFIHSWGTSAGFLCGHEMPLFFRPSATISRNGLMESRVRCRRRCGGPPPGYLTPPPWLADPPPRLATPPAD